MDLLDSVKNLDRALALPIPLREMPLLSSVMLAEFLIETSITMQRFSPGLQGCGSPIDVLTITADEGVRWLRRKASLPSRMPEATSLPIFWTQPQVRVSTSGDPRRASSYTACR